MLDERRPPEQEQSKGEDPARPADDAHGECPPFHGMLFLACMVGEFLRWGLVRLDARIGVPIATEKKPTIFTVTVVQ
jgi:hypothetical protein